MVQRIIILTSLLISQIAWSAINGESVLTKYDSNIQMRDHRKVGVGLQLGGSTGLLGLFVDLNFENQDGAQVGLGQGVGFSAFSIAWKHSFEGQYISPYMLLGWSRWFNSAGLQKPESHILDQTLNAAEKAESRFGLDFIETSVGAQYQELEGEYAGAGFFAQATLMSSLSRGKIIPHASLGISYYF
jgi:hypothetical protein